MNAGRPSPVATGRNLGEPDTAEGWKARVRLGLPVTVPKLCLSLHSVLLHTTKQNDEDIEKTPENKIETAHDH